MDALKEEQPDADGRTRVRYSKRLELYKMLMERLSGIEVGICKETAEMHSELLGWSETVLGIRCNCTL